MAIGRYKMGTLSRLTGYKPELLRAWQRRFGLFAPARTKGGHRLYTDDDLAVALHVRELLAGGRSIGEVAREGREALLVQARRWRGGIPGAAAGDRPADPGMDDGPGAAWTGAAPTVAGDPGSGAASVDGSSGPALGWGALGAPHPAAVRSTGGLREDLAEATEAIVRGAVGMDPRRVRAGLDRAFALASPDAVISDVLKPASHRIGKLWEQGRCGVAGERLASSLMRARLIGLVEWATPPVGHAAPGVLCACLPDEFHENGALVVAYRLGRAGWRVTWLGAAVPIADLDAATERLTPQAVYLSAVIARRFDDARADLLDYTRRWGRRLDLVLGGQGAPVADPELQALGLRLTPGWTTPVLAPGGRSSAI